MGYCLQDVVSWYQKKIGTYDKQPWEKTVEQHILNGFTPITKKTAKLKTELIDIDLIRGSSFTKAKPKHGLMTVTRLATMRLVFLPMHSHWWMQQTSFSVFALLLLLYILQIVNMTLYFYFCPYHLDSDEVEIVSLSEVLVPLAMMFGLSIIHSQIVSPYSSVNQCSSNMKTRRAKRSKRRLASNSRYRGSLGSDSKSSPDTGSELTANLQGSKCRKRVRLRNVSPDDAVVSRAKKSQPIVVEVKEYCEELRPSVPSQIDAEAVEVDVSQNRSSLVDDGFESLNGNGSSDNNEEEESGEGQVAKSVTIEATDVPPREGVLHGSHIHTIYTCTSTSSDPYTFSGCAGEADETDHKDTDSEPTRPRPAATSQKLLNRRRGSLQSLNMKLAESSYNSSGESDDGETVATSAAEWIGVTTNSEECSYSSDLEEHAASTESTANDHLFAWEFQISPAAILSPSCASSDKVSCTMWDKREVKKAELSVLDISSAIIARVEGMPESLDYFYGGLIGGVLLSAVPSLCRLSMAISDGNVAGLTLNMTSLLSSDMISESFDNLTNAAFGATLWERTVILIAMLERMLLGGLFFFLLGIAERTYKQRFLYAKFFSHLTSFRRARKSELPHFRLNKVRNIKTWLSVRSYLKKRGPQRSVDVVVSAAFIATLLLLSFLSVELLKDSVHLRSVYNIEALAWSLVLGVFLLRFMTLGTKINRKYRNLSVLITEQINLYLQIEQKPNKKEELMVANSVLKLAADLLKELESPFKISGLSANPYLYTITKVVILSALSGVLSEMLGFKLKLHKIKIK